MDHCIFAGTNPTGAQPQ